MDTPTAVTLDAASLLSLGQRVCWIALRTGGMLMAAPLVGTPAVPGRIRLLLALSLALVIALLLPNLATIPRLDIQLVLVIARETLLGIAMGFIFRLAFEAAAFAGELVAHSLGLSFAQMLDPLRGANTPIMTQWFTLAAGLIFLAFDGHLALIRVLFESYRLLPIEGERMWPNGLLSVIPAFASNLFAVGTSMALPIVIGMLTVNFAFGILARTAPSLNPIALGLPALLLLGLICLVALLPYLVGPLISLFEQAISSALSLAR